MAMAALDASGGVTVWNLDASGGVAVWTATEAAPDASTSPPPKQHKLGVGGEGRGQKAKAGPSAAIGRAENLAPDAPPLSTEWTESVEATQHAAAGARKAVHMWAGERSERLIQLHPHGRPWEKLEMQPRELIMPPPAAHPEHRLADLDPVIPVWTAKGEFLPEIHGGKFSREALRGRDVLRSAMAGEFAKELEKQVRLMAHGSPELAMTRSSLQLLHSKR